MSYDFLDVLKYNDGFWQYSGGPYLAELTSGKISTVFLNTGIVTTDPELLARAAVVLLINAGLLSLPKQVFSEHAFKLNEYCTVKPTEDNTRITHVIGPAFGGIALALEVARILGAKALFTEPVYKTPFRQDRIDEYNRWNGNGGKGAVWHEPATIKDGQTFRFDLPNNAKILFVEDVITTGQSTREMMCAVKASDAVPNVLCLVNRNYSQKHDAFVGSIEMNTGNTYESSLGKISSLVNVKARIWNSLEDAQKDCPNAVATLKPKKNWAQLISGKL